MPNARIDAARGAQHDGKVEVDFMADSPGLTPFHYHQQLHMDFGFMALFDYA